MLSDSRSLERVGGGRYGAFLMVPGVLVFSQSTLQVSAEPLLISETVSSSTGTTSDTTTVSAVGGSNLYTYTWTQTSGSTDIAVGSPSAATTDFDYNFSYPGLFSATFQCEVDDGDGAVGVVSVNVIIYWNNVS